MNNNPKTNRNKIASRNADNRSRVHCPGKVSNACPEEKTSITTGRNKQRESHLHMIRRRCLNCATTSREVTFCTSWDCPLHSYRFGVLPKTFGNRLASEYSPDATRAGGERYWEPDWPLIRKLPKHSPLKAIRQHCLWCNGSPKGVAECCVSTCPLHLLGGGNDPRRKKPKLTDLQRADFVKQMETARKASQ